MDKWPPASPFSIDYLWVGLIQPGWAELGWAARSKHLLCLLSPSLFLGRSKGRGGEGRGAERRGGEGASATLRVHSLPLTNAGAHQNMRSDLCLHHLALHKQMRRPCTGCLHTGEVTGSRDRFALWCALKMQVRRVDELLPLVHCEKIPKSGVMFALTLWRRRAVTSPGVFVKATADMNPRPRQLHWLTEALQVFYPPPLLGWSHVHVRPPVTLSARTDAPSTPHASDGANVGPLQHLFGGNERAWRECCWWRGAEGWRRRRHSGPVQDQKEWKPPSEFGWERTLHWKSKRRGTASVSLPSCKSPSSTLDRIASLYTPLIALLIRSSSIYSPWHN